MPTNRSFKVIVHDSVSLDGAFIGFDFPPELMGLHYQVADQFGSSVRLVGSRTALASIEMFGGLTPETLEDFVKPQRGSDLSYWAIPDSKAVLQGKLHYFRRSEYCRDVAVVVAEDTPEEYLRYLTERHYDHFVAGKERVDLAAGLEMIAACYASNCIMVDAGRSLTNSLLDRALVDEISLLVVPTIVGRGARTLFSDLQKSVSLSLETAQALPGSFTHLLYKVIK